jgi:thiol-disulfide isomerase/thioredoxin
VIGIAPGMGRAAAARCLRSAACALLLAGVLQIPPAVAQDGARPGIPDQGFPDLQGEMQNLQQWRGRILLLNFWATWCAPCLAEIPHLIEFQRNWGDAGLQVVGLGLDEPRKLQNVQRSLQINYPLLVVEAKQGRRILRAWGNRSGLIPYSVIFDRQGKVVKAHRGIIDEEQFAAMVKPLLESSGD